MQQQQQQQRALYREYDIINLGQRFADITMVHILLDLDHILRLG